MFKGEGQMILLKKLALVVSVVFGASLVLAAAVVAATGGDLGPGSYSFTSKEAGATFGTPKGGPSSQQGFSVIVDRGLNSFRPKDPKAPRTVLNTSIVSLVIFDDAGDATFGCFIINPSDFTVSNDLQSAKLHTTLTADQVCPGYGSPVTGTKGAPPFGGPGGGAALPLPISLDFSWTGAGVAVTGTDRSTTQCLDYSTQFNSSYQSSSASASGTISAIAGSFNTPNAGVTSSDIKATIKGTPKPACFPQ
jgi:hypothetical protein